MNNRKRVVIKVGTKVITSKERSLDREMVREVARQVSDIEDGGTEVVLVTSGAIGAGMWLVNMKKRPVDRIAELQATAAIGQSYLMHLYGEYFKARGYLVGQMLLTQEDFNDRKRYLNIKHTINAIFKHKGIPVINENDTVAVEEIKCGDNDRLSGLVADLCQADRLILLTDVDGLLDEDGNVMRTVPAVTGRILKLGGKSVCDLGIGGMATKLESARTVTEAGIECVIANGKEKDILLKIMSGESVGTTFLGKKARFIARKRWIAFSSSPKGAIVVDDGAKRAVQEKNKSLLASGITGISGKFIQGDVVSIKGSDGKEFARGVCGYSSGDLYKIKGLNSGKFKSVLGCEGPDEAVHKDNLALIEWKELNDKR